MNIFYLDKDAKLAAQMHHDKHVCKMIIELAQLLCTAHRILDGTEYIELTKYNRKIKRWKHKNTVLDTLLYKATHVNHPSAKWVRETSENYRWAFELFSELCKEYTFRYNKIHKTEEKLLSTLASLPKNIHFGEMTKVPQAMPDVYRTEDSIQAYRNYYTQEKKTQSKYTNRQKPYWL